jgi:hypothetical protein
MGAKLNRFLTLVQLKHAAQQQYMTEPAVNFWGGNQHVHPDNGGGKLFGCQQFGVSAIRQLLLMYTSCSVC